MTHDQWFVINGVHHQGPFALDKLKQMARESDFTHIHRFWCPGMKESIDRDEFFKKHLGIGLPEIPKKDSFSEISINSDNEINFNMDDFFDASNGEAAIDKSPSVPQTSMKVAPLITSKDEEEDLNALLPNLPEKKKFSLLKFLKFVAAVGAFAVLCAGGFYSYKFIKPELKRPEGLRVDDHRELIKCYQKMGQICFDIALTKDYAKIFLVSNKELTGNLSILLTSKSDDNFSLKRIVLKSTAPIENQTALFNLLEFEEGVNLVPGIYDVRISSDQKVLMNKKNHYLGLIEINLFKKQLDQLKNNLVNKRIRPWRELEEKYQTLAALLLNIRSELKTVLFENKKDSFKERSKLFDQAYRTKFGQMFTIFVLTNDDSKGTEASTAQVYKKDVLAYYEQLETLAKSLGTVTVETISVLEKMTSKNKVTKQTMLLRKFQDLETLINNKKKVISAKVLSLKEL